MHDRDEDCVLGDRLCHIVGIHETILVSWNIGNGEPRLFKSLRWMEDRKMFDLRDNYMLTLLAVRLGDAFEREIVRFGAAGRKKNFLGLRPDEHRNLCTRLVYGVFSF